MEKTSLSLGNAQVLATLRLPYRKATGWYIGQTTAWDSWQMHSVWPRVSLNSYMPRPSPPISKNTVSKKYFSTWRRKQRRGGGMDDGDFTRSHWKSWEWCLPAAPGYSWLGSLSCRCNLGKRPSPSKVRKGQGSSCCGGGEATWNEGLVEQAWTELLPGFAFITRGNCSASPLPGRGMSACAKGLRWDAASTWWEEKQLGFSNKWGKKSEKMSYEEHGRKKKKFENHWIIILW